MKAGEANTISRLISEAERDLIVQGATAIEDKLQAPHHQNSSQPLSYPCFSCSSSQRWLGVHRMVYRSYFQTFDQLGLRYGC